MYPSIAFLLLALQQPLQTDAPRRLVLTEVRSISLPSEFHPGGLNGASPENLVLWSKEGSILLIGPDNFVQRQTQLTSTNLLAVSHRDHHTRAVVARHPPELLLVDSSGTITERRALPFDGQLLDAAVMTDTMYILLGLSEQLLTLRGVHRRPDGSLTGLGEQRFLLTPQHTKLAAHSTGIILFETRPPYRLLLLNPDLQASEVVFEPSAEWMPRLGYRLDDGWYALRPLLIDGRVLQVFSDLRSDQRLLVLYDLQGRVQRVHALDVALGFVGLLGEAGLIAALRNVGQRELVLYSYTWR